MTRSTVYLLVEASDDASEQWTAKVTARDNPDDWFIAKGDYVLIEELIEAIYAMARKMWPGELLEVAECTVKDDDDCGYLKPMLQRRLDVFNDLNRGAGRFVTFVPTE